MFFIQSAVTTMAAEGNGYDVSPRENDPTRDQEVRELKEKIEKYKESMRRLEERIHNLKARETLTASQQDRLRRFQDGHSKACDQLK